MASKIEVNLDTSKEFYEVIKCKQNDDLTLIANIFENGAAKDLTNCSIVIQARKKDNTYVIQNTDIKKLDKKFEANLVRDFTRVPGETKIEVVLVESGNQNTTFSFCLEVVESVIKGAEESKDLITSLEVMQDAVIEMGKISEETKTLIENSGAASKEEMNKVNASLADKASKAGQVFTGEVKVKRDDAYLSVEDMAGRKLGMHCNGGLAWLHFFDQNSNVINGFTFDLSGKVSLGPLSINRKPCCKVYHPNNQILPGNSVKNILAWNSILFSSHPGMCGNVGTTANIVAPENGIYQFDATITFLGATGQVQVTLSKNNSELIDTQYLICTSGGTNTLHLSGSYSMNQGEYAQVHFYYTGSNSITVSNESRFQAYLVREVI